MPAKVDENKCSGCGVCMEYCAFDAIQLKNGIAVIDETACVECGACAGQCPNKAISFP